MANHPRFSDFLRIFDRMRLENPGRFNYAALHRAIAKIDPSIPYITVYVFFRRLHDPFLVKRDIKRAELREGKKKLAHLALQEVLKDPSTLSIKDRIKLGENATREELVETQMVLNEKHKQKAESLMDKLLDDARYGTIEGSVEEPTSILDKRAENADLPELTEGTGEGA